MLFFETVHCALTAARPSPRARVEALPGKQEYIEDCEVCCRPIVFRGLRPTRARADGRILGIEARRDDD
jgi:hypothetical protein